MNRKLINWLGILGVLSLLSYVVAVIFSPLAYPGYNWMEQAVSDLSANTAPSKELWSQLAILYEKCGIVSITCVCVYVCDNKISSKLFRLGIYLFAGMNWISCIGYSLFPLSDSGKAIDTFQDIMHVYVVTVGVVLLSIVSLVLIILAGIKSKDIRTISIWAGITFIMMLIGAIGTGIVPGKYFGIVERFSVFSVAIFNAILGIYLFLGFGNIKKIQN